MQGHMHNGHKAHISEPYNEQHQKGNGGVILIHECIQYDQNKVPAHKQFENRHDTRCSQIALCCPAVLLTLNPVLRRSFETGLDTQQCFHDCLGVTHGKAYSQRHEEWQVFETESPV